MTRLVRVFVNEFERICRVSLINICVIIFFVMIENFRDTICSLVVAKLIFMIVASLISSHISLFFDSLITSHTLRLVI